MVCLETTFLIDLFRGTDAAAACLERLQETHEPISIAAPSLLEVATGAELAEDAKESERLRAFLASVIVLPLDEASALLAGKVNAGLIRAGEVIGAIDTLIGAIAATHSQRVVTRNVRHFSRVPGLEIERY